MSRRAPRRRLLRCFSGVVRQHEVHPSWGGKWTTADFEYDCPLRRAVDALDTSALFCEEWGSSHAPPIDVHSGRVRVGGIGVPVSVSLIDGAWSAERRLCVVRGVDATPGPPVATSVHSPLQRGTGLSAGRWSIRLSASSALGGRNATDCCAERRAGYAAAKCAARR